MTQHTTQEWDAAIERELDPIERGDQQVPALDDATRDRTVGEVEATLRKAQKAGGDLDERSFLRGAMATFLAVYGEVEGRLPLAPPKWIFAERRGKSIFGR